MDRFADLLIEIGTEELPPVALPRLSAAFTESVRSQLASYGISHDRIEPFATPRRLALLVRGTQTRQPDQEILRRGPAVRAAFDGDGNPTPALIGFARSCGVEPDALEREETDKGDWLVFKSVRPGQETAQLVPAITEAALAELPIPKRMRWGARTEEFVRPVHWICLILGSDPIDGSVLGIPATAYTRGHRFHHPEQILIDSAANYADTLRTLGKVEPSFEKRRELIQDQITRVAAASELTAKMESDLLDEVTALVEWPQALLCHFDPSYLEIPPEVLIETMQRNQKYFPLVKPSGELDASFIVITNLMSRNPDQVRAGNERVIKPRFADAAFFWTQDLKLPLSGFRERLERVVFQEKLGTVAEKCDRVAHLGRVISGALQTDPTLIERAAHLAKCDLVTSMVYEFPGLQGTMGRYYAERSNEDPCVSQAMADQYLPRFAGDALPASGCGKALAIADRIDTLIGIFGIGLRPSGTKDPYALRRASIAVLRILIETPVELDLAELLKEAAGGYTSGRLSADAVDLVLGYMLDRLTGYYADRGIHSDTVEAVLATGASSPADIDRRIAAVTAFKELAASDTLAAANKRIRNILSKAETVDLATGSMDRALLADPAEIRLAARVDELRSAIHPFIDSRDYTNILLTLADLKDDIDSFFTDVMVMAEDSAIRRNRIRLLQSVAELFMLVADISRLQ